jgi:DNA helicase-2/ATP-dependent DNA helicase PcrA
MAAPESGTGLVDSDQRRSRAAAILANLDDQQREAARVRGPAIVLGGAGSGKTRVLAHRVAMLVAGGEAPARRVLAFGRTEREAALLRARAERLLGAPLHGAWIDTIENVCLRILRAHAAALGRKPSFVVLGASEARVLVRNAGREAGLAQYSPARLQELIALAKIAGGVPEAPVDEVYHLYETALAEANAFDAEDLVRRVIELLDSDASLRGKYRRRFSHVVIDDFEDVTPPQRELVAKLCGEDGDVVAAADDQQRIAPAASTGDERDARSRFLEAFPGAGVLSLTRSYRSSGRITLLAARIAARNDGDAVPEVMKKKGRRVAAAVLADESEEAAHVVAWLSRLARRLKAPLGRTAILFRHPVQARPFEEALARAEIAYRVVGAPRFYERREIKDVVAYLKLTVGGGDPVALARIANVPRRGIGPASVATIGRLAKTGRHTMAEAALRAASLPRVTAQRAGALADLGRLLTDLDEAARRLPLAELIDYVVERSGYARLLSELSRAEEETRREGIDELRGLARALPGPAAQTLPTLLARVERADPDQGEPLGREARRARARASERDGVQLLTIAEAKGRDFDIVFMTGLEEGLLPGVRAIGLGETAIQAERRLFYVGITRARTRLVFTRALARTIFGRPRPGEPSRFLAEAGKRVRAFRLGQARPSRGPARPEEALAASADREPSPAPQPAAQPALLSVRVGQRVIHPRYGPGLVTRLEPAAGPGAMTVSVAFDEGGEKRLALAYARLQPA